MGAGERLAVSLTVNGEPRRAEATTATLLVEFLRDGLGLKGTHVGCLTGDCGACTVLLDGLAVKACCVLAATVDGAEVVTLEGLGTPEALHPLQQLFWDRHAFQCGFCLPGMIFSTLELLNEEPDPTEADVRRALSGNLCRCTGYQTQVAAVLEAARTLRVAAS
jgi:carbon-monoxide dehydrogenase small subunit